MTYTEMTVKQLLEVAKDMEITGRHKMKREELLVAIEAALKATQKADAAEETKTTASEVPAEPTKANEGNISRRGKVRTIEVWKDGELVKTIEGLIKTLNWAVDNGVSNQGWVKHSLKTGKETVAGRKFKQGGYLFKYVD